MLQLLWRHTVIDPSDKQLPVLAKLMHLQAESKALQYNNNNFHLSVGEIYISTITFLMVNHARQMTDLQAKYNTERNNT